MWKTWNLRCLSKFFSHKNSSKTEQSSLVPLKTCNSSSLSQILPFNESNSSDNDGSSDHEERNHKKTSETETLLHLSPTLLETLGWVGTGFTIAMNWKLVCQNHVWKDKSCSPSDSLEKFMSYTSRQNLLLWRIAFAMPCNAGLDKNLNVKLALPTAAHPSTESTNSSPNQTKTELNFEPKKQSATQPVLSIAEATKDFQSATAEYFSHIETLAGLQIIKTDERKGFLHFKRGSKLGNPKANFNLGICYETGMGTQVDLDKAAHHYQLASEAGHSLATFNLGIFYLDGRGNVPKDGEKGISLIKRAAENGVTQAQTFMGLHYAQLRKWHLAFPLIKKASIKSAEAQHYLAVCYENGLGVKPDLEKAEQLFSKARAAGFTKEGTLLNGPHHGKRLQQECQPIKESSRISQVYSNGDIKIPSYLDDILRQLQKGKDREPLFWIGDYEDTSNFDVVTS